MCQRVSIAALGIWMLMASGCASQPKVTAFGPSADFTKSIRVAVLPFVAAADPTNNAVVVGSMTPSQNGEIISSMVAEAMMGTGAYRIIERSRLREILEELDLSLSDLVDKKGYEEVGRLLGADALVVGNVSRYYQTGGLWFFGEVSFSVRCIDVTTGEVLWSASPAVSDFRLVQDQARELCRQIGDDITNKRREQLNAPR